MTERQRGLGRGLSALLEEASAEQPVAPPQAPSAGGVRHLPIELIRANPDQPRKNFDAEELAALGESVRARGVIQPIIVRPRRGHEGEFEIVALDWPGQGQSPRGTGPVTAQHYAAVATQAMVALGLGRPVVLGNSIGGAAAILMAAAGAPMRGLVLCDPGGLTPLTPTARRVIRAMAAYGGPPSARLSCISCTSWFDPVRAVRGCLFVRRERPRWTPGRRKA